jgi:hypothetical protein
MAKKLVEKYKCQGFFHNLQESSLEISVTAIT